MRSTSSKRVRTHGASPWTRDRRAWAQLTDQYAPMLWSVARSVGLTETEAAEAIQRTWLSLLDNRAHVPDAAALPTWLARTVRREAMTVARTAGPVVTGKPDRERDAEQLLDESDAQLWDAFTQLSAECQELLRAVTAPDRPDYADVAAALGRPVDSIESSCHACLERLRQLLGPPPRH